MARSFRTELSYAVRLHVICKYWGQLCLVSAALTMVPVAVAIGAKEFYLITRYAIVIAALAIGGFLLSRINAPGRIQKNEALVIVAMAFLSTPLIMSWPMMVSGIGFVDALFEAVSAITTTGLSTLASVEDKPDTFLFARAWMQWYGGLGVVVLALAIVVQPGQLAKRLSLGQVDTGDPVGGTRAHFRRILIVYGLLTAVAIALLWFFGAGLFNAVVYALAAVSTGGFAAHDQSLAALPGFVPAILTTIVCIAASLSLVFYHRAYAHGLREFFTDPQFIALFVLMTLQSIILYLAMRHAGGMSWRDAAWHAPMLAASAQSTAGFSTMSLDTLEPISKTLLIISMFIGGGAGSTAGGVKLLRILMLMSVVLTTLRRTTMPSHAVLVPRLGRKDSNRLDDAEIREALAIITLAALIVMFSWLPFIAYGHDPLTSLFEVVSATGTVGLSAGLVGPDLSPVLKLVLCACMLLGRLEIIAWLVLFYPRTWFGQRRENTKRIKVTLTRTRLK